MDLLELFCMALNNRIVASEYLKDYSNADICAAQDELVKFAGLLSINQDVFDNISPETQRYIVALKTFADYKKYKIFLQHFLKKDQDQELPNPYLALLKMFAYDELEIEDPLQFLRIYHAFLTKCQPLSIDDESLFRPMQIKMKDRVKDQLNNCLDNWNGQIQRSGLTQELVSDLKNEWAKNFSKFKYFKGLYPKEHVVFFSDEFTLSISMIARQRRFARRSFVLRSTLEMIFECSFMSLSDHKISEIKQLLILLASGDERVISTQAITLLMSSPFNVSDWQSLKCNGESLSEFSVRNANEELETQIRGEAPDPTWFDRVLMQAVNTVPLDSERITQVLSRQEPASRPTQEGVKNALYAAARQDSLHALNLMLNSCYPMYESVNTVLFDAIKNDNHNVVMNMLASQYMMRVNVAKILSYAAQKSRLAIIDIFLTYKDITQNDINNALHVAVKCDQIDVVNKLLTLEDISRRPTKQFVEILLYSAAQRGFFRTFNRLLVLEYLTQGIVDRSLYYAAKNGHLEIVNKLLTLEDESQRPTKEGIEDALYHAAGNGHVEVVRRLLPLRDQAQDSIVKRTLNFAAINGHIEVVNELLATENLTQENIDHALCYAAKNGHLNVVQRLLILENQSQRPTQNGINGATHHAAAKGEVAIVKVLLSCVKKNTQRQLVYVPPAIHTLLALHGRSKFSTQDGVDQALSWAVDNSDLAVLNALKNSSQPPTEQAVDALLVHLNDGMSEHLKKRPFIVNILKAMKKSHQRNTSQQESAFLQGSAFHIWVKPTRKRKRSNSQDELASNNTSSITPG